MIIRTILGMCPYSASKVSGYELSKTAWWHEWEFSEVLLGPIHKIVSGEISLKLP